MSKPATIYSIRLSEQGVKITPGPKTFKLPDYQNLASVAADGVTYLVGYDSEAGAVSFHQPTSGKLVHTRTVGKGWTLMETFVFGNQPYLALYKAEKGIFGIFSVGADAALSKPYLFFRNHEPGFTHGFSMIRPFRLRDLFAFMGYNDSNGNVAVYTLTTIARSPAGVPPLLLTAAWSHQWAKGWTRFAFFDFGGGSFFLKTNIDKPNVNIDHVYDDPSAGTVEVASYLDLAGAQEHEFVLSFTLGHGDPYFLTYIKDGTTTVNRVYGDCTGWDTVAKLDAIPQAGAGVAFGGPHGAINVVFY
jgi:hypothetical protein